MPDRMARSFAGQGLVMDSTGSEHRTPKWVRGSARRPAASGQRGRPFPVTVPLLLALLLLPGSGGGPRATAEDEQTPAPSGVPGLSEAERSWLADHPVIRVAPDPDFPPFEFLDRAGRYQGMAADYVGLLEKKLGIRFEVQRLESWTAVLEKARAREVDLLPAAARTPQREEYLAFTAPHIRLPGVILTSTQTQGALSLDALAGRSVAVVNGYVWHDLLANDHPDIKLVPVPDTGTGLQMAAFQIVDVFFV